MINTNPIVRIRRSAVPGKKPTVDQLLLGELGLNTFDAELYTLRSRPGIGSDVVRIGAGTTVTNILYVTRDGNDTNTGKKLGDAKRTIGAALTAATTGTVIKVSSGYYVEDNPLILPRQVSVVGDSLREVSVSPQNPDQDLFHVSEGNYITEMSYVGSMNPGSAIFAFNPNQVGFSSQSPYIRNCTNFISNSIGMKINGNHVLGPFKSMVTDSFTQYNQAGIGVSITNGGYAQLVSLFTICPDIAVYCGSGGACDLTNSNASFGNYGLVSDGVSVKKYTGIVTVSADTNSDVFTLDLSVPSFTVSGAEYNNTTGVTTITTTTNHNFEVGVGVTIIGLGFVCPSDDGTTVVSYPSGNYGYVFDVKDVPAANQFVVNVGPSTLPHSYVVGTGGTVSISVSRPFAGQVVYFDQLYYTIGKIVITNPGSGYNSNPSVVIESPSTTWGVSATAAADVVNGSVNIIDLVSSGRGYTSVPSITISAPNVGINTATAVVELLPTYYSIVNSTPLTPTGICTVTVNENVPYAVGVGTTVPFFKQSRVLASGHSFEYIGSGTNIVSSLPAQGGVPIQENEIDMRNGGIVVYTSTDQSGNFRIGEGVAINQLTGTISGRFYSKSLFSAMTPFILALGGE